MCWRPLCDQESSGGILWENVCRHIAPQPAICSGKSESSWVTWVALADDGTVLGQARRRELGGQVGIVWMGSDLMSLEFSNLPLVEVSVRLFFATDLPLSLHDGTRAQVTLSERFPDFRDLEQLEPGLSGTSRVVMPFVPGFGGGGHFGFRYTGGETGLEITLQTNLLSIRWAKRPENESRPYPRFEKLEENLWWAESKLRKTLSLPPVSALNMRYANFITTGEETSGSVLHDYFSDKVAIAMMSNAQVLHNVDVSWREGDGIDRRFSVSKGVSGDVQGFLVTTIAGMQLPSEDSKTKGLNRVHDFLLEFFATLISSRAKKEWGLE
jgi:uncharacterized protein (TIGR04255 family)